jgi:hypothetical protein
MENQSSRLLKGEMAMWWRKKSDGTVVAGEPYEVMRRRELSAEIERLSSKMKENDERIGAFVQKYFRLDNFRLAFRVSDPAERELREREIRALENERAEMLRQWHATLAEYANLS